MGAVSSGLLLACALGTACAQEMRPPRVVQLNVDWEAARSALATNASATTGSASPVASNNDAAVKPSSVAQSGVPVLLPVALRIAPPRSAEAEQPPATDKASEIEPRLTFLMMGPSGYDAAFAVRPAGAEREVGILISGTSLLYEIDDPKLLVDEPVKDKDLAAQFPGMRRIFLEHHLRYVFERFGVAYVISTECYDGPSRGRRLSCISADQLLTSFAKALRFVGGAPRPAGQPPATVERPQGSSPTFTYVSPGRLLPNTGYRGRNGTPDYTIYAKIRFPLAAAPAYANSQSFLNWGDCDSTGRSSIVRAKGASYSCRVNGRPLVFDESAAENRSYPWRDNFCEHRSFLVGQCAGGHGHQGQDIRAATCKLRNAGGDRCLPYQDDVVAVRDGMILRAPGRELTYLFVNAPGEHIRFRYLHMNPAMLDASGVLNGRSVRESEVLGKVGTFDRREFGTTYHLHFDTQVLTRHGWTFVNPYMTLVAAYERLIGGRGREIPEEALPEPALATVGVPHAVTEAQVPPETGSPRRGHAKVDSEDNDRRTGNGASRGISENLKIANLPRAESLSFRRGERSGAARESRRPRAKPARAIRPMDHRVPAEGRRARRFGSDLHARDERAKARHSSLRTRR
jgi:hypothetical protein